ncbi:MAG: hypothetical protein RR290_00280 [Clostridia bacterium]
MLQFTDKEKIENFDKITKMFYECNFGEMSKSEIELLMFSIYIDKLIKNESNDSELNYNNISNYKISKELGITQMRVDNLKIKKQLKYPIKFDWQKSLAILLDTAKYDNASKKIIINIPDPNLYYEIQNFIESTNNYIEIQLNKKILQLRVEVFIELAIYCENEKNQKAIIKKIKEQFKNDKNYFETKNVARDLISVGADITTILANVSTVFSPTNYLFNGIVKMIGTLNNGI